MEMRTFRAPSMAQALVEVKRGLGPDAVILHTRSIRTGGLLGIGGRAGVEVTAASKRAQARPTATKPAPATRPAKPVQPRPTPADAKPVVKPSPKPIARTTPGPVVTNPAARQAPVGSRPKKPAAKANGRPTPAPRDPQRAPDIRTRAIRAATVQPDPQTERARSDIHRELDAVRAMLRDVLDARAGATGIGGAMPEALAALYERLLEQETDQALAAEVIGRVRDELSIGELADPQIVRDTLSRVLALRIETASPATGRPGRPRRVMLMGPTGVGKTTTVAKLAAQLAVRRGQKVGLVTCDTYRIAAAEQLRTYASIMDLPLEVVSSPEGVGEACAKFAGFDAVLIDTAGRSPSDSARISELAAFAEAADADECHLVASLTSGARSIERIAQRFAPGRADRLLLTKLDEAYCLGPLLTLGARTGLPIGVVTTGQEVPDDLEPAKPERLARAVLDGLERRVPEPASRTGAPVSAPAGATS